MKTIRGHECDHCAKVTTRDIYTDPSNTWVFIGDANNHTTAEGLRFGIVPIKVLVPRTLEFCSETCCQSFMLEAITEHTTRLDQMRRLMHCYLEEDLLTLEQDRREDERSW